MEGEKVSIVALSKFTWKIPNFSKSSENKLYTDIFIAGDCKWRLLIFPKGNKDKDHLSIYLDVADSANLPQGWSIEAKFSLAVVNQFDKSATVAKETEHDFNASVSDWGFTSFIPLSKINDPAEGYLEKDTLTGEVEVLVLSTVNSSITDTEKDVVKLEPKKCACNFEVKEDTQVASDTPITAEPLNHSKGVTEPTAVTTDQESPMPLTEGTKIHPEIISKRLLTELSSRRKKQKSIASNETLASRPESTTNIYQQQKEALRGFFNMPFEAIQQANCFVKIEAILDDLVQHTTNLQDKASLEDKVTRLANFKRSIDDAKDIEAIAQARRTSLVGKTAGLDLKLEQRQQELSSLETEFSTLTEEETKLKAETDRVIAQKKSVSVNWERSNEETCKEMEEWRILEEEMRQVNEEWFGAKEKLASANVRWDRFREDLCI